MLGVNVQFPVNKSMYKHVVTVHLMNDDHPIMSLLDETWVAVSSMQGRYSTKDKLVTINCNLTEAYVFQHPSETGLDDNPPRSSMVGDIYVINNDAYMVAPVGFRSMENNGDYWTILELPHILASAFGLKEPAV